MAKMVIRPADPEDIEALAPRLRTADRLEIWASNHHTPDRALRESFRRSEQPMTLEYDGRIAAMFGVVRKTLLSRSGCIWLLGSDDIALMPKLFVRHTRLMVETFLTEYDLLENWVDARYEQSVKWLRICGARIDPAEPFGTEQALFHHFEWRR